MVEDEDLRWSTPPNNSRGVFVSAGPDATPQPNDDESTFLKSPLRGRSENENRERAKHMNPFPPPDADLRSARPPRVSLPVAGRNDRRRDDRRPALSRQMFKGVVLETEIQLKFEVWKHLAERLDNRRGGAPCGLKAHPPLRVGVQIWRPRR